jgi:hypothetical protein
MGVVLIRHWTSHKASRPDVKPQGEAHDQNRILRYDGYFKGAHIRPEKSNVSVERAACPRWRQALYLSSVRSCHRPAYRSQDVIGILEPADDRRNEARA